MTGFTDTPVSRILSAIQRTRVVELKVRGLLAIAASLVAGLGGVTPTGPSDSSLDAARQLFRDGWYARGELVARDVVRRLEAAGSTTSSELAEALYLIAESGNQRWLSRYSDAQEIADRALTLHEQLYGESSPLVARVLRTRGWIEWDHGQRSRAVEDWDRAIRILGASDPRWEPELGAIYCAKAWNDYANGDYAAGKTRTDQGLGLLRRHSESPPAYVALCMNSALVAIEDPETKRRGLEQLLEYRTRNLGAGHHTVAMTRHNLAGGLIDEGRFDDAVAQYRRNGEIFESRLGPESLLSLMSHNHVVLALRAKGDLANALAAVQEARRVAAKVYGDHPEEADTEFAYGEILEQLGDVELAESAYRAACRFRPTAPNCLADLSRLLVEQHRFEEARPLLEQLEEAPEMWWPGMKRTGWALAELGRAAQQQGKLGQATDYFSRALATATANNPAASRIVARRNIELATVLLDADRLTEGAAHAEAAFNVAKLEEHKEDVLVLDALLCLARSKLLLGDADAAFELARRACTVARLRVRRGLWALPERQALWVTRDRVEPLELLLAAAARDRGHGSQARRDAWDAVVRDRGLVLDEIVMRRRLSDVVERPAAEARMLDALQNAESRYATLSFRQLERELTEAEQRALQQAAEQSSKLEREIAIGAPSVNTLLQGREIDLEAVLRALPSGTALLAYARWEYGGSSGYSAFLCRSGSQEVVSVRLGPADEIDKSVADWLADLGGEHSSSQAQENQRELGAAVRRRIWDPVTAALGAARFVFVVADGAIARTSLAALPDEAGSYLLETGPTFHYLPAERDLVRWSKRQTSGRGLLVVGNPSFGGKPTQVSKLQRFRSVLPTCSNLGTLEFSPLPETAAEVSAIGKLWEDQRGESVVSLAGLEAGETAVRSLANGKRWIHLATHGLVLDDSCASRRRTPNPLLLSSLALAGANLRHETGSKEDDGLLTAEEIATLELRGVEAVVLSGCRTGRGQIRPGEGIVGLQRAFHAAGARAVVMSLWDVADHPTRRWMEQFYEARLRSKQSIPEAVREASLWLMRSYKERGLQADPAVWGAFISAGDWR